MQTVPVVLFAYARPDHLRKTLEGLRRNDIPLLYIYCDGPASPEVRPRVESVRTLARAVDWCDVRLVERDANLGLGVSIRTGVSDVLSRHDRLLVFEDDIVALPGAYTYLCAALDAYADDPRVMSVSAWSHPRIRPPVPEGMPFFSGRFACWGWGTWRRAWAAGMDVPAEQLLSQCQSKGINPARYGMDLPYMAREEKALNIWAVRFVLLHILNKAVCLCPYTTLVENVGFDSQATHTQSDDGWAQDLPQAAVRVPARWPTPREHRSVPKRWQKMRGELPGILMRLKITIARLRGRYPPRDGG